MAKKEITSRPGLFGTTNHYDSKGRKIGESRPGMFGTTNHYDANGRKIGSSSPGLFGSTSHRDANGRQVGSTRTLGAASSAEAICAVSGKKALHSSKHNICTRRFFMRRKPPWMGCTLIHE